MFPLEKQNARKLSFTWKMDSPEEEELFLLGFILLDDKKKNKNKKKTFKLLSPYIFFKIKPI